MAKCAVCDGPIEQLWLKDQTKQQLFDTLTPFLVITSWKEDTADENDKKLCLNCLHNGLLTFIEQSKKDQTETSQIPENNVVDPEAKLETSKPADIADGEPAPAIQQQSQQNLNVSKAQEAKQSQIPVQKSNVSIAKPQPEAENIIASKINESAIKQQSRVSQIKPEASKLVADQNVNLLQEEIGNLRAEITTLRSQLAIEMKERRNTQSQDKNTATSQIHHSTAQIALNKSEIRAIQKGVSTVEMNFTILQKIEAFFEREKSIPPEIEQFLSLKELDVGVRLKTKAVMEAAGEQLNIKILMLLENFCEDLERKGKQLDSLRELIVKGIQDSKIMFLPVEVEQSLEVIKRKKEFLIQALEDMRQIKQQFKGDSQSSRLIPTV